MAIGLTRATPATARASADALVGRDRADRGDELVAGDDVARARRAAAARACWPTPPSATTIARPIASAPSGQRGPAAIAGERARGRAAPRAGGCSGTAARRAGPGRQEERREQRRDQEDAVDGEGRRDAARPGRPRPDEQAGERRRRRRRRPASRAARAARRAGRAAPGAPRPAGSGRRAGPARSRPRS